MDASDRRHRTSEILAQYSAARSRFDEAEIGDMSFSALTQLDDLLRETIRVLRENLADCVRTERRVTERRTTERRGLQRWAKTTTADSDNTEIVDPANTEVKAELDNAIQKLTAEKAEVRAATLKSTPDPRRVEAEIKVEDAPADSTGAEDQLTKLVALHTAGVLTAEEFAAAKERLV